LNLQAKLLRVLETGEMERVGSSKTRRVDVRVLSATNAEVQQEILSGKFREDLLFRLNTIEIHLPALRERREDLPLLANHFLSQFGQRYRKSLVGFDAAAMQTLLDYPWPGNVRELEHAVERGVLMASGETVRTGDLGLRPAREASVDGSSVEEMALEEVERLLIRKALARYEGNVSKAAEALGLSRSGVYRRLKKFGL
jgi:DNA-binding NtrC family response regulator